MAWDKSKSLKWLDGFSNDKQFCLSTRHWIFKCHSTLYIDKCKMENAANTFLIAPTPFTIILRVLFLIILLSQSPGYFHLAKALLYRQLEGVYNWKIFAVTTYTRVISTIFFYNISQELHRGMMGYKWQRIYCRCIILYHFNLTVLMILKHTAKWPLNNYFTMLAWLLCGRF